MADIYHLYLDESETHINGNNRVFSIAGIIVKEDYHNTVLTQELHALKSSIWNDCPNYNNIILHEKEIRFVQNPNNKYKLNKIDAEYHRFKSKGVSRKLYTGLEKIIRSKDITVIGGCIVFDELYKNFSENIIPNKELIVLQIVFENFSHFLYRNNSIGKVFYEHIGDASDQDMSMRFHQIKSMGTMYIKPYAIQKLIMSIDFPHKQDNIPGLQIADFIPNDIARGAINKRQHEFNLTRVINRSRYDGGVNREDKYGVKILPRII